MKTKIQTIPSILCWACSVISALAFLGIAASGAFAQARYRITDLGTLGGTTSDARGINNHGQVVGASYTNGNNMDTTHAFLYNGGAMTDSGTLGGTSGANGLNDQGQVVGWSNTPGTNEETHAFLWSAVTRMTDLGTLGGSLSIAYGINNNGHIVGVARTSNEVEHAFFYSAGTMNDLNSLVPTNSGWVLASAAAIGDGGEIAGIAISNGFSRPFLYSGGAVTILDVLPGGSDSVALGLNTNGQVVGYSTIPGLYMNAHAFLCSGGVLTDLGDLGGAFSFATGVNNHGQIVGWSATTNMPWPAVEHPFLYRGGKLTDLGSLIAADSGWGEAKAAGIKDNGWITGYGQNPAGSKHAFLLTPLPSLDITSSGLNVLLSWPTNATGFALAENSDLATTNWGAVMTAPVVTNGQYQVVLPTLPGNSRFYRLQSQ